MEDSSAIDKEVVRAYYEGLEVVAEIEGLQFKDKRVNVAYHYSPKSNPPGSHLSLNYEGITWLFTVDINGRVLHCAPYAENESDNSRTAIEWLAAHNELGSGQQSQKRLDVAQRVYNNVRARVVQIPSVQNKIGNFKTYFEQFKEEQEQEKLRMNALEKARREGLIEKTKGQPDPLNSLVALIE